MTIFPNKLHHEIIPGILEQEWHTIDQKIQQIKPFANVIHIDLLDGIFAPNKTFFDPEPFQKHTGDFIFELHMMVDNPVQYLKPWAAVGFQRFIGQIEKIPDITAFVAEGQLVGEVGLALDTPTPVEKITIPFDDVDFLFVMTVKAGFSRQAFLPDMLEKVKALRAKSEFIPIEVDGGITDQTLPLALQAGATRFVSTGFLFGGADCQQQYKKLTSFVANTAGGSLLA